MLPDTASQTGNHARRHVNTAVLTGHVLLQEEDAGLGERRRQSAAGLRGAEHPLTPVMVSHVVDALFDRSLPCPPE